MFFSGKQSYNIFPFFGLPTTKLHRNHFRQIFHVNLNIIVGNMTDMPPYFVQQTNVFTNLHLNTNAN